MRKILFIFLAMIFINSVCYASTIKGIMEKVDLKKYEIAVGGKIVDVSKADIFTENDMHVTKTVIIRDLKDNLGSNVICYGSVGKENVFNAYKVRVFEGHY